MIADRNTLVERLKEETLFDLLVVGGGATGCGVALDAASRGLKVALVEKGDFAFGTSGRSTKLVHGGVRYLESAVLHLDRVQFNLVRDALQERGLLLKLAPHLCHRIPLVTPVYRWSEVPYLFAGLKLYDSLAGEMGLGRSQLLHKYETLRRFPFVRGKKLKAGVLYYDGQFNDARMNLALALTAVTHGATLANYVEVTALCKEGGKLTGAEVRDRFSGSHWRIRARCVVNACGPFADGLRLMDDPAATPLLRVSSGVHIVLDQQFTPPDAGITIPKTEDGRVLFILPWQGQCLIGTTDRDASPTEHPVAAEDDIQYLLRHLNRYFDVNVERSEIRSAWAGLRPLVQDPKTADTARLARDHVLSHSPSGLVTIAGGKWTTYRRMARDTVDFAVRQVGLAPQFPCLTDQIRLTGGFGYRPQNAAILVERYDIDEESAEHLNQSYGDRYLEVAELCRGALGERLLPKYPYLKGEVLYAVRHEMAQTAADFLVRRIPLALLNQDGALKATPVVVELMARELGWGPERVARELESMEI